MKLFTLRNPNGMVVEITNYGGIVTSIKVPDRQGNLADVVLGFDSPAQYLTNSPYFGAIVGRYGNRIAKGRFTLDGVEYKLATNNGANHLHGGVNGFDKVFWDVASATSQTLELTYTSKDGEEGYPGTLVVKVTYTLTANNELKIEYHAITDKPTMVNLTSHSYFNLAGEGRGDILGHQMMINADHFTPADEGLIPTGELTTVEGTPFDFREPCALGARINAADEQLVRGGGYDHNFVINRALDGLMLAARVVEPCNGRMMEVFTTEPGVQLYTGNFLDGSVGGKVYKKRYGFCLETQHFPDSPNQPNFPTTVLREGEEYRSTTVYRFTTDLEG
ncbi:MAG: aldose epimerase family protein [bacterium]|nr:aldose epimerase family protein [bacterium]